MCLFPPRTLPHIFVCEQIQVRLNVLIELSIARPKHARETCEEHSHRAHNSSPNIRRITATVRAQLAFW